MSTPVIASISSLGRTSAACLDTSGVAWTLQGVPSAWVALPVNTYSAPLLSVHDDGARGVVAVDTANVAWSYTPRAGWVALLSSTFVRQS
jgi:hypothetical protein